MGSRQLMAILHWGTERAYPTYGAMVYIGNLENLRFCGNSQFRHGTSKFPEALAEPIILVVNRVIANRN